MSYRLEISLQPYNSIKKVRVTRKNILAHEPQGDGEKKKSR